MADRRVLPRGVRSSSLSLVFGAMFLAALVGQAFTGWAAFNDEQAAAQLAQVSLGEYLTSAAFAVDVAENWQSEYLQFLLYILGTVWLVQRGSPESKEPGKSGPESDEAQRVGRFATRESPRWAATGGLRTFVYSWSLVLVMGSIFVASWLVQSVAGWAAFNETRLQQLRDPVSWPAYLAGPRLLGPHPSELAVGVPGGWLDGGAHDLPAGAGLTGEQARRGLPRDHRRRGMSVSSPRGVARFPTGTDAEGSQGRHGSWACRTRIACGRW